MSLHDSTPFVHMSLWSWFGPIFLRPRLICEKAILHSWGQLPNLGLNGSDSDLVLHFVNLKPAIVGVLETPFSFCLSCQLLLEHLEFLVYRH